MTDRTPGVALRDGIEVVLSDGTTVVADARAPAGDVTALTHAHGDHLFAGDPGPVVCSPATADIARARRPDATVAVASDPRVELVNAGHVAGSRAVVVTDPADGTRYCYTGDCSTRDRLYLDGFDPPDADVLVIETTYGTPEYRLPPQRAVEAAIGDWLADTADTPVLLFGYSLGRAQKLQVLAERAGRDRVFATDAVVRVNRAMEPHVDVSFPAERYDGDVALEPGDALVLPPNASRRDWVERLRERHDAPAAGFSGWAVDDSFRYRGGYDATFALSDHCDFDELNAVIDAVAPDRVFTNHGAAASFADHLVGRGYEATALRENQHTLADF
ncbi:MBL fold metallo-hydrolase RNA specificity domain-containing protein [Halobaculum lipolyticum]|uniref:MBL fold metallo-hydrolase RNA specificity domain-containing protein n=1 Tax=Halobaculum lipolyticum TaxID=3032001 RepID=A0ABD5WEU4_9EURY|nr:MBL fold metallo-hydrolase RNA specificity domain-containing protein [Halobaculum sp. DT31]